MWRDFGAALAVLALVCGLSAAPYTHAHHAIDSASDAHHPSGATLVHTHASPHSHAARDHDSEPTREEDGEDQISSLDNFVFQQAAPNQPPAPAFFVSVRPDVQLTSTWLGADRLQPPAHGPPTGSTSGLRAPPAFLPALV